MNKDFDDKISKLIGNMDNKPKEDKHINHNKRSRNNKKPNSKNCYKKNDKNKENSKKKKFKDIKKLPNGVLRIIPIGGVEEVGKNCTVFEYANDIIIVDIGLQFPIDGMHGVEYIIPDYSYLEKNKKKIRGVIITHAHLDHIGGIPYVFEALDLKASIYGSDFTCKIIERRQKEFGRDLPLKKVKAKDMVRLGCFSVNFIHVNHTIPGCLGVSISTPVGNVVYLGDWKIDYTPVGDKTADLGHIATIGKSGVTALLADSTNAYKEGFQKSESVVMDTFDSIFAKSKGRIIIGTFSSSLSRIQQIIIIAEKYNRRLFFAGYSMLSNVEIAKELKFLKYNQKTIVESKQFKKLPDSNVVVVCTGSQGEENAALSKISENRHRDIKIQPNDTIIFSSSVIPGNEQSIQLLLDKLYRKGAKVINIEELDVHAGGHAKAEEVKLIYNLLKPKNYITVHGNHYLLKKHAELIESIGHPKDRIISPDNGTIIHIHKNGRMEKSGEKIRNSIIAIDGLGVGDIGTSVIKDRKTMAENGIFIIIITVDRKNNQLMRDPEIVSKGFVFMKTSEILINESMRLTKKIFNENRNLLPKQEQELKHTIRRELDTLFYKKTEREPMIIPVIIGI